ncbi:MAG: hypothetical protein EPN20_01690 [Magnetospirillum sp.]|nr:MAG: hypothetical protein EPN20_01690 [Magnetospirillum sp.]
MPREVNCLPHRIETLLAVINRGEIDLMLRMIDESAACPWAGECDVGAACVRIHAAFLPLASRA